MRLKSLLPWLCVLAPLLGLAWMYTENQKKDQELTVLRDASDQAQKLSTELEEIKANHDQVDTNEVARLRKDNEELLRLRNEVRQLRGDKQQLNSQLQTAQTQVQGVQAQMEALRAVPAQPVPPGQPNPAAPPGALGRPGAAPASPEQANTLTCQNNLRIIQGAKQQWATEQQKPASITMTAADLAPYMRSNTLPVCPAGGVYTLNPVSLAPICSIPGHAVPR